MFTVGINLLPPSKRTRLKKIVRFLFIKEMLEFCIFTLALLSIIHVLGGLVLTKTLSDLAESSLLINREFPTINSDIGKINKLVRDVNESAVGFSILSPKLFELIQSIPPDIRLDAVNLNRDTLSLSISGVAKTRNALLRFQTVLTTIPWINQVSTPVSQLLQKEDIPFEIQTTVKDIAPSRTSKKSPTAKTQKSLD